MVRLATDLADPGARLKEISRRDARQFLRDLPEIHPFVEAYVLLYSFDGQFGEIIPIGPVANGFRLDGHFGGT